MEKFWLAAYPPDVPHTIDPGQYDSLVHLIENACADYSDRPAFSNFGSTLSFADFEGDAHAFAAYLQQVAKISSGARVALMMPNILAYPVALFGALKAGAVVVNTNPQYTARELAHQLSDSGAELIVVFEQSLQTVADVLDAVPGLKIIVAHIGDFMPWAKAQVFNRFARRRGAIARVAASVTLAQALKEGRQARFEAPAISSTDLAFLQYTGGTTGRSKGAMLTHRNVVANILQVNAWFGGLLQPGREIIITALPLYHIYALTGNCLAFLSQGGLNCLITDPRNLKTFIKEIKRVPFTTMSGVNTLFNALLQHPHFTDVDFSTLKFTSGGGTAVQRAVAEQWHRVTGSVIAEGYGLTESSPVVSANRFDIDQFTGGIGLPLPSTEVRIIADDGTELDHGEPGELCVRGPQVMRGYWNNAEETARMLDPDGWLKTGDVAVMAVDGYLRIVDRKKDLIIVSGFNVYPNEIEDVAVLHPDISEAAAIGISDAKSSEAVRLVVVRRSVALDEQTVIDWCRTQLAGYKIPRSVVFADELPKSNVGKILRRQVRDLFGDKSDG